MHVEGEKLLGRAPEQTYPGQSLLPQAARIKKLIERTGALTILDYGSGKGMQYSISPIEIRSIGKWDNIMDYWDVDSVHCYDPCYEPFSVLPASKFDGVISTDVLEHCPEEDMRWIIEEIFGYATYFVFANIACYPARRQLPNGENAHCTIQPKEWWEGMLKDISAKYPNIVWEVWVESVIEDAEGKKRVEEKLSNT
jgi:hypothetical protein